MNHWTNQYFGQLYHEIYSEYILEPERALEEAAFAAQVLDLGRRQVLDLACGYGRHARLLAASNRVVALDNNGDYVREVSSGANKRVAANLHPVQGDMRQLPLADRSFDAAIMLFNSFGYFDTDSSELEEDAGAEEGQRQVWKLPSVFYERQLVDESFGKFRDPAPSDKRAESKSATASADNAGENVQVLRETYRVLKPGGGLLLEIPNKRLLLEVVEENPRRLMVMDKCEIHEQFEWREDIGRLVNRTRFVFDDREEASGYSIRLYEPGEVKDLLAGVGFRVRRTYGDYEGNRFGPASSDILLVHATRPVREKKTS